MWDNYCDENGCVNRKRNLVEITDKPKQVEEIEAVEFLDFVLSSGWHLNPHSKENRWRTIEQINSTKPMLSDGITTKQLYEIFKNQK